MTNLVNTLLAITATLVGLVLIGVIIELLTTGWFEWLKRRDHE